MGDQTVIVCPRDRTPLSESDHDLVCSELHRYRVERGVPILLRDEIAPTQPGYWSTDDEAYLEFVDARRTPGRLHPYVRRVLRPTLGNLYQGLELDRYPIPTLPLPDGDGRFLDIGSNWGRWCIAAARAGYRPVGVDPSWGATVVARSVAEELAVEAEFYVADGRHLPFPDESFDIVFSYSVLQHLPKAAAREVLSEAVRVLRPGGTLLAQFPNRFGLWNLLQQARRRFHEASGFDVRYWSRAELRAAGARVGSTELVIDAFLSLNAQAADIELLRRRHRAVVRLSNALRRLRVLGPVADSVYVRSVKPG